MDRTEGIWRLKEFVKRLKLKRPRDVYPRIPGKSGGHINAATWSHWLHEDRPEWPSRDHLVGLVDNCIEDRLIRAGDRARWILAADLVVDPTRGTREQFLDRLEGLPVDPAPPEPVVFVSPDHSRDGWSFSDCAARQFLNAAQSRCGLTAEQAHAALARLVGKAGNLQTRLYFTVGSRGSLTFYPGPRTFVVVTQGGRRQSFDVVGDGVSGWMEEEAGHGA